MNISTSTKSNFLTLLVFLIISGLYTTASAQIQYHQVLMNSTFEHEYYSAVFTNNNVTQPARHGDASIVSLGGNGTLFNLVYTPNAGYLGLDTCTISLSLQGPAGPQLTYQTHVFEVVEAYVNAVDDYVSTDMNTQVSINVLENDFATGDLLLNNIPLVNKGTAEQIDSYIVFTPEPDYVGTAQFHYTVCTEGSDGSDICDVGVVTVFINADNEVHNTVQVVTTKNQAIEVLLPLDNGFDLTTPSSDGNTSEINNGLISYTPDNDFVGVDEFKYAWNLNSNNISSTLFKITVLDVDEPNSFAMDDYGYVAINSDVLVDVLSNDLANDLNVQSVGDAENGTTQKVNGQVLYTPNNGFTGLDKFTYRTCPFVGGTCENAEVLIFVSNQNPSVTTFELTTPINTPLILNYTVPIDDWNFVVNEEESVEGGLVEYNPGQTTSVILDQYVAGFNLLVYSPPTGFSGEDEFDFQYCVGGNCEIVKIKVTVSDLIAVDGDPFCVTDCVWSGDANNDGTVNMLDLLPIGYCIGHAGLARDEASMEWYGQYGNNWGASVSQEVVNLKYVDTDGNGFITAEDTVAMSYSYGLNHNLTSEVAQDNSDIPLFFRTLNTTPPGPGDLVQIEILLGTENIPALDVNGLTFSLNFNTTIVEEGTFQIDFFEDNWLAYNSPMLSMTKAPYYGKLDAGYTRTKGKGAHGYGAIGQVSFIIIDNLDGNRQGDVVQMNLGFSDASMMNGQSTVEGVPTEDITIDIVIDNERDEISDKDLIIYPNPTQDIFNLHLNGAKNNLERIYLFSINGQMVYDSGNVDGKKVEVDVTNIDSGLYFLKAISEKGIYNQRVEIFKDK